MAVPLLTFVGPLLAGGATAVVLWEKFVDGPDVVNNYGPDWKGYAVLGLAAAGGFYLASRLVR